MSIEARNGRHPLWVPIEVDSVPDSPARASKHADKYESVLLRLEQTPATRWLCYEFATVKEAETMRSVMYTWFRKHYGPKYLKLTVRGANLYIRRGDEWYKP